MYNWILGRRKEGQNGTKAVFEDIFLKLRIFPNLREILTHRFKKLCKLKA